MTDADVDVVVVGAGLAGLSAAWHLQRSGFAVRVLEAGAEAGGRVRTDVVDGFRLDRGFQLLNPAYPAVRSMVDLPALRPNRLRRLVRVVSGDDVRVLGNPLDRPAALADLARRPIPAGVRELAGLLAMSTRDATSPARLLTGAADRSTERELARFGLTGDLATSILRPFLSGVFGERELATSGRFFHLVWRSFLRAAPVLPADGMAALPRQLAGHLADGVLSLDTPVDRVHDGGVDTAAGARVTARAVVVATDATTAAHLVPEVGEPGWHGLTTYYYRPGEPPYDQPVLTVDADGGPVVNTLVVSAVGPGYAPPGQALVSASALTADGAGEAAVRRRLGDLYRTGTSGWDLVARYEIPHALPRMPAPHPLRHPVRVRPGRYVCGDHRDTSSIQGALVSGRRAARAVRTDLGPPGRSAEPVDPIL